MVIIPVEINTSDITSQFNINKVQIEQMLDGVAKSLAMIYFSKLEQEAINNLHSTRNRYLRNIQLVDSGRLEGTVLLDYSKDKMVKMLEEGQSPFDMKPGILNGPKSKVSKKGVRYNTVPMRWATSGVIGESEMFSNRMPSEIYNLVRNESTNITQVRGSRSQGLTRGQLPVHLQTPGVRPTIKDSAGKVLFQQYTHKHSIYEGMVKKTDGVTGQSAYMSWRRVSENSDSNAFIHPGIKAWGFMKTAVSKMNVEHEVGHLIDKELLKLGF